MTTNISALTPSNHKIPQTKGHFLIGNLPEFRNDPIAFLDRSWREFGDLYQFYAGPRSFTVVSSPELARQVLIDQKHTFHRGRNFNGGTPLTMILGLSLLTTDGESWLSKRRTMQPIFHRQRIQKMGDVMMDAGLRMMDRWQSSSDKEITLNEEMKLVTLDIINRTMFSTDIMGEVDNVGSVVDIGLHYITRRLSSLLPAPMSWPTPANLRFKKAKAILDDYLYRIIRERRAIVAAGGEAKGDLLDMLMEARDEETGETMNDEQVRNEVATIYGAGHETTALALTWTWYALWQNPEVLRKLQHEVDVVLQGQTPTMADLPRLPYTLQVFEESMRLYPPVPFTVRMPEEVVELDGHPLAKGEFTLINIHNLHRHPSYWDRPEEFWPERFAPENKQANQRAAYMPFLTGPHMCIGNNFALMEGQLLLAMMAQKYEMELIPGQRIEKEATVTMRPKYGMKMRLVARQ
ncbi:MAG: cytochrome P450 [Caldilineaceae bacterium]